MIILRRNLGFRLLLAGLIVTLSSSVIASSNIGAMSIPLADAWSAITNKTLFMPLPNDDHISLAQENVIWELRLPRIALAVDIGAGLALAGVVMQASVQNELAEPCILCMSAGASFGATLAIMFRSASWALFGMGATPLFAFIGASVSTFGVLALASAGGKMTSSKLVLSGMVLNALFTALSNFVITIAADAEGMLDLKFWTTGSLVRANWDNVFAPILLVACVFTFFCTQFRPLNILLTSDEAAMALGINTARRRWIHLCLSSLMVGMLVAAAGTIGFVGLMIPHIARALVGPDYRRLIPAAALAGSIFMLWADAFARTLISNSEVPIGILTALVGAPFFAIIMLKQNHIFKGN